MGRLCAASAAMVVCLAFEAAALAQEASPSASLPPPETVPTPDGSSMLSLEVTDLVGMYGLEVGADLIESHTWGPHLFGQMVHEDDATVTANLSLEPGRYSLAVYAGEPPCEVRFTPWCGLDEPVPVVPEYECLMEFDLEPNEALDLRIAGLPRSEPGVIAGCPMSQLLHPESPTRTDGLRASRPVEVAASRPSFLEPGRRGARHTW